MPLCLLLALGACGGGGGSGGGAVVIIDPPLSPSEQPLKLSATQSPQLFKVGMGYGGVALAMAQLAANWTEPFASPGNAGKPLVRACDGGGSVTLTLTDKDGNGIASNGDQLSVQLNGCWLRALDERFSGSLSLSYDLPGSGESMAARIQFGDSFGVSSGQAQLTLQGGLTVGYGRSLQQSSLRARTIGQTFALRASGNGKTLIDQVTSLDARQLLDRTQARYKVDMAYALVSDTLQGRVNVETTKSFEGWFDSYPDRGELTISGASGQIARLSPNTASALLLDASINGSSVGTLTQVTLEAEPLWSAGSWGVSELGSSVGYRIIDAGTDRLRQLSAEPTSASRPKSGPLVWVFNRPLKIDGTPSARFVHLGAQPNANFVDGNVEANVRVDGAMISVTPLAQFAPGNSYQLVFDSASLNTLSDAAGNTLPGPRLAVLAQQSVLARATVAAPGALIGQAGLALDGSASQAEDKPVSAAHWRQISGPTLSFTKTDALRTEVSASGNGTAVVELEVRNQADEWDRVQLSIPVIGAPEQAAVAKVVKGQQMVSLSTDNSPSPSGTRAHFFADTQVLDVFFDPSRTAFYRMLAKLPPGQTWQTGLNIAFGAGSNPALGLSAGLSSDTLPCEQAAQSGDIKVLEYLADASGDVSKLALDLNIRCNGAAEAVWVGVRIRSAVPMSR